MKSHRKDEWFDRHTEEAFSDILLCAGLIHDIGNPPFGHFGEYAVREWFKRSLPLLTYKGRSVSEILSDWQKQDLYCFEGNAQSLRLLSKTPHLGKNNGFNLSFSILGSIIKYPISAADLKKNNPYRYKKAGYHYSERLLFENMNMPSACIRNCSYKSIKRGYAF